MKAERFFAMYPNAGDAEVVVDINGELVPITGVEHRTRADKVVIHLDRFKLLKSLEKLKSAAQDDA